MATIRLIKMHSPTFKPQFGWEAKFLDHYPQGIDAGGLRVISPAMHNDPTAKFLNTGFVWKTNPKDSGTYALPKEQIAIFCEAGYLNENPKPASQYNQGDAEALGLRIANLNAGSVADSMDESNINEPLRWDNNQMGVYYYSRKAAMRARELGNIYDGTYQGDVYADQIEDSAKQQLFIDCLTNQATRQANLQIGGVFNRWQNLTFRPDFDATNLNLLKHGKSVIINQYVGPGGVNGRIAERMIESLLNAIIGKQGRADLGATNLARVLNFMWLGNCETSYSQGVPGFSGKTLRPAAGGNVQTLSFPGYSTTYQYDLVTMLLMLRTDVESWNNPETFSRDPSTRADAPGVSFIGTGAGPTPKPINDNSLSGTGDRGYPAKPAGVFDLLGYGAKRYEKLWKFTNNKTFAFLPIRKKGETNWLTNDETQIIRAYQQGRAICMGNAGTGATDKLGSAFVYALDAGIYEVKMPDNTVLEMRDAETKYLSARTGYGFNIDGH